MTTREVVRLFRAKRSGNWKGKPSYSCKCPSHRDRMPSLSITEGAKGETYLHCFRGCTTDEILGAKGMQIADLFPDSGWKPSPAMTQVWKDEEELARLEHQYGLAMIAQAVFPAEARYWKEVEQRLFEHCHDLRCKLFPAEWRRHCREVEVQRVIAEYGLDELWECVP